MQMKREFSTKGYSDRPARILPLLAVLVAGFGFDRALAAEVYTWTDPQGVTHFSDVPPENAESRQIEVEDAYRPGSSGAYPVAEPAQAGPGDEAAEPPGESAKSIAQQRREQLAKDREEKRIAQQENQILCAKFQQRLEQMEPARRVFYTNEAGEQVRMDDEERVGLVDEAKEYLAKNCR